MQFSIEDASTGTNLVAWCSFWKNNVSVYDFETKQKYVEFVGAQNHIGTCNLQIAFNNCLILIFVI